MGVKSRNDVLHNVRANLYVNHLTHVQGKFIARTSNEASLDIAQVCTTLASRGGFAGDYETLVMNVQEYFDEMVYQLCDGYAVNTGYFTIFPNIGGTFSSLREGFDPEKHPITFRFRALAKLRAQVKNITVSILGLAATQGFIDEFTDVATGNINETVSGGDMFTITGDKIKVASDGDNEECGVFLEPVDEPGRLIKVTRPLAENLNHKIIGTMPVLMAPSRYRLVIVSQFNGSNKTFLKKPKRLVSKFELLCQ